MKFVFEPMVLEELLVRYNFFELFPFDGGGSFVTRDILGSLDDREITQRILAHGALDEFGALPELDFLKFERWRSIEKSCWINRLYFIVPLARVWYLDRNEAAGKMVRDVLLYFKRNFPPPVDCNAVCELSARVIHARDHEYNVKGADFDGVAEYQWFDFQPAARIIHMLHALWFLLDFDLFSAEEMEEIGEMLYLHGRNLFWSEKYAAKPARGNHQALRALALLYVCAALRHLPVCAEWVPEAEALCEFHILTDFLPDGMLYDLSPSYHFFESWMAREMIALADRYGFQLSAEARERAAQAFRVCRMLRQPDGFSTVLNDGYPLNMACFLQTLPDVPEATDSSERLLRDSRLAIWSAGDCFVLLDATPRFGRFAHYHAGKLGVTLFLAGKPFLVDSGCCNYDDEAFGAWFKTARAHSSLLIDGREDSVREGRYGWLHSPDCRLGEWRDGSIDSQLTSDAPGWEHVCWRRSLRVAADEVVIMDAVSAPPERDLCLIFNFHPDVEIELDGAIAVLRNGDVRVCVEFPAVPESGEGMTMAGFVKRPCRQLLLRGNGALDSTLRFRLLQRSLR